MGNLLRTFSSSNSYNKRLQDSFQFKNLFALNNLILNLNLTKWVFQKKCKYQINLFIVLINRQGCRLTGFKCNYPKIVC